MMVSVETYLLRMKRRTAKWRERPAVQWMIRSAASFGSGMLLSGIQIWGQMQPVAIGLIMGSGGWRCCFAALGSALGYRLFWPGQWIRGAAWAAGALLLALVLPLIPDSMRLPTRMAVGAACVTAGTELAMQVGSDGIGTGLFLLRIVLAAGCGYWGQAVVSGRVRMEKWLGGGLLAMGMGSIQPLAGFAAAGAAATWLPMPAGMLAAMGAELGSGRTFPLVFCICLSFFLQKLPVLGERTRKMAAPGAACGIWMVLQHRWEPGPLLAVGLGGALGALLPWRELKLPRRSILGLVQVRLEQTARILTRFQRQLLEYVPPPADVEAVAEELRKSTCEGCALRHGCPEQKRIGAALLMEGEAFACRKSENVNAELRRSRQQLRRMKASRAVQAEFRMALVQQYGFLADALQRISDRLPEGEPRSARFRVQVSARSRSRGKADGDWVTAFPGQACRFYVLLCDGMGTGFGAAEESMHASELIRQMLTAGLPPETVMGSINSQLALTQRGGAVTMDLAEIRLGSGKVWLYKWGAGPSWILRRKRGIPVGASGPPPGLGVTEGRENTVHIGLGHGEVLVMASDGIRAENADQWAGIAGQCGTGELAERILKDSSEEDDATAVVVRLVPVRK